MAAEPYILQLGDIEYSVDSTHLTITDYTNVTEKDIEIPATFTDDGTIYNVTEIGSSAFNADSLTSVIIPNSVTFIGGNAFSYNLLTSVVIPNSVTSIQSGAFFDNALTSITIPNSVTMLQSMIFNKNEINEVNGEISDGLIYDRNSDGTDDSTTIACYGGAAKVIDFIPDAVTTINAQAFYGTSISSVVISDSVTYIGLQAFTHNNLTSVAIPNSVTTIGERAFSYNALTSVTIPSSVTTIGELTFSYNDLTSVTIPNSVNSIGTMAFDNNESLTSIDLPVDVMGYEGGHWENAASDTVTEIVDFSTSYSAIVPFEVTFIDYDSALISIVSANSGSTVVTPEDPIREGYTFTGWDGSLYGLKEDVTVQAQYVKNYDDLDKFVFAEMTNDAVNVYFAYSGSFSTITSFNASNFELFLGDSINWDLGVLSGGGQFNQGVLEEPYVLSGESWSFNFARLSSVDDVNYMVFSSPIPADSLKENLTFSTIIYIDSLKDSDGSGVNGYWQFENVIQVSNEVLPELVITDNSAELEMDEFESFTLKFTSENSIGNTFWQFTNVPTLATANTKDGEVFFDTPDAGEYTFDVTATDDVRSVQKTVKLEVISRDIVEATFRVSVDDSLISNAVVSVKKAYKTYDIQVTDSYGEAMFTLKKDSLYEIIVAPNPDDVDPDLYREYTYSIKISDKKLYKLKIKSLPLVIQGINFYADNIDFQKGKNIYTLSGGVTADSVIFFDGDDEVLIDNDNDVIGSLKTKNALVFKGDINTQELMVEASDRRKFYLKSGVILPSGEDIFTLKGVGGITFNGYLMSLYEDEDEDDKGIEFGVFPAIPLVEDVIQSAGFYVRDLMFDAMMYSNIDFDDVMFGAHIVSSYWLSSTASDSTYSFKADAMKADSTMNKLYDKLESLPISIPSINVISRYSVNDGISNAVEISDLSVCFGSLGFQGLEFSYTNNKTLGYAEWHGAGMVQWGGKCEGSEFSRTHASDTTSRNYVESNVRTFEDLQTTVENTFGQYEDLQNVSVIVRSVDGIVVYESSYDEFVDVTDEMEEMTFYEDRFLNGLGADFTIKDGKLDEIIITADVEIPLGAWGKLTQITGGVSGLTNFKNGKTTYSTKNLEMMVGCNVEMMSKFASISDAKIIVKPWSYYEISGDLSVNDKPWFTSCFNFDTKKDLFTGDVTLIKSASKGVLSGGGYLAIGGDYGFSGYISGSVQVPEKDDLPTAFRWAAGMNVGSATIGASKKMIGARVSLGKEVTTYTKVAESDRSWLSRKRKRLKRAAKRAAAKALKAAKVVVKYVTVAVKNIINFDVSVGYDFTKDKVVFGDNVKIPEAKRVCYRGDSLIYDFNVDADVSFLYLTCTSDGNVPLDFDLYDVDMNLVTDQASWTVDSSLNEVMAIVTLPAQGTWRLKADTTNHTNIVIHPFYMDNEPEGIFVSPTACDTTTSVVRVAFNDINDTLDIGIYVDDDKADFNGQLISQFKIQNNANIKFSYTPTNLHTGEHFFYYIVSDGSNVPTYKYAAGSLYVLPNDSMPLPQGVKVASVEDSVTFVWDAKDDDTIDYVAVKMIDVNSGEVFEKDISDLSSCTFNDLSLSHTYAYSLSNISYAEGESNSVTGEVLVLSSRHNNPPLIVTNEKTIYSIYEQDSLNIALDFEDPDNDVISIRNVGTALPKTATFDVQHFAWRPEYGENGFYEFDLEVSDGRDVDTLNLKVLVDLVYAKDIDINFGSRKLYESDNMFLTLDYPESENEVETAWLFNYTKGDSIAVEMTRQDDKSFMGYFQLSYQRRSILSVSEGDTLIAEFITGEDTAMAIAYFDSIPQLVDNTIPHTVSDLEAHYIGDRVRVTYTVPYDEIDGGLFASPWYYDLRYASEDLSTEEVFLSSDYVESLDRYAMAAPGEQDTLWFDFDELNVLANGHRVWFNIKTLDGKLNESVMSNTCYIDYYVDPSDLTSSFVSENVISLDWKGSEVLPQDPFLLYYNVYRKYNTGVYSFVGEAYATTFKDTLPDYLSDGLLGYEVKAIYADAISNATRADGIILDRYSNVDISFTHYDPNSSISYNLILKSLNSTNEYSLPIHSKETIGIADVKHDTYTVQIMNKDSLCLDSTIIVSSKNNKFEFELVNDITAISVISAADLLIYPNPAVDVLTVTPSNSVCEISKVSIFSLDGQLLISKDNDNMSKVNVEISDLASGIYLMSIHTDDNTSIFNTKFIKR